MKVRCISDYVTEEQRAALGRRPYQGSIESGVTIGVEYLVLGLSFEADADHVSTGPYVTILDNHGNPVAHDLCLFEITDPRVSRYWQIQTLQFDGRQIVEMYPPALLEVFCTLEDEGRTLDEQDEAYFAFLRSDSFTETCALLREEYEHGALT